MTAKLALGWGAISCVNAYNPGRLFGSNYSYVAISTMGDGSGGWFGWGSNPATTAACEQLAGAVIQFLTGKTSNANLLVHMPEATSNVESWGPGFRAWATAQGHTLVFTGGINAGSLPFNGHTLTDYDAVLVNTVTTSVGRREDLDIETYLTVQGGRVWSKVTSSTWLGRFGMSYGGMQSYVASNLSSFNCAPLGGGTFKTVLGSFIDIGAVAVGGTVTKYASLDTPSEGSCAIWSQD
jgi:hypothetical protein